MSDLVMSSSPGGEQAHEREPYGKDAVLSEDEIQQARELVAEAAQEPWEFEPEEWIAQAAVLLPQALDALDARDQMLTTINGQYLEQLARADAAQAERDKAMADNQALRTALEFYANTNHYRVYQECEVEEGGSLLYCAPRVIQDNGTRARAALSGSPQPNEVRAQ